MRPRRQPAAVLLLAALLVAGCADRGDRPSDAAIGPPVDGVTEVVAKDNRSSPA
jgi:hypothetical protein